MRYITNVVSFTFNVDQWIKICINQTAVKAMTTDLLHVHNQCLSTCVLSHHYYIVRGQGMLDEQ